MSSLSQKKSTEVWEFGDFQTPDALAFQATQLVKALGVDPHTIIEPTCGLGVFLLAAAKAFPHAKRILGVEINRLYIDELRLHIERENVNAPVEILHADFFALNWIEMIKELPDPILFIGNPPWVTSAELGMLQSSNLPEKTNFQGHRGIDALTGKSNFDISEWMLLQQLEWLRQRQGTIAVLCKSSVARKVLLHAWKHDFPISRSQIYKIDAQKNFNASVDACFFIIHLNQSENKSLSCDIYEDLISPIHFQTIGYIDGHLVADMSSYEQWRHLAGGNDIYTWRSGVKHDCTKIMELELSEKGFRNGNGIETLLETDYIYPMFKSSDLGSGRALKCRKYMLVTQSYVGEDTSHIKQVAPRTWQYLQDNREALEKRSSSIYKNRPPFSVFGVGDYTFAPWKVAISGFYKSLKFRIIGPLDKRPVIFDDTIYFLPCWSEIEAKFLLDLLNSSVATEFFESIIFWSNKRPITVEILKRLDIKALAQHLGREEEYYLHASTREIQSLKDGIQARLFTV